MSTYPAISDHGLIGDLQTTALVATDGTIDWFCTPRFDSPSVFASLLDQERGGRFRIAPSNEEYVTKQLYFPDTAILITRFMTPDGVGEVVDFMPIATPERATDRHRIVRLVRVVRGEMEFVLECEPRFDYGTSDPRRRGDRPRGDLPLQGTRALPPWHGPARAARSRRARHMARPLGRGRWGHPGVGGGRRAPEARPARRAWTCSTRPFASGVSGSADRRTGAAGRRRCTVRR